MLRRRLREIAPVSVEPLTLLLVTFLPVLLATTAMWVFDDRLQTSWGASWSLAARIWLLGFGVSSQVTGGALVANSTIDPFMFSLAPLSLLAVGIWTTWQSGRRGVELGPLRLIWGAYAAVLAAAVLLIAGTASNADAQVSFWAALLIPWFINTAVFIAATLVHDPDSAASTAVRAALRRGRERLLPEGTSRADAEPFVGAVLRGSAVTLVALTAAAALGLTVSTLVHWMDIVAVYESLHGGWSGVIILSLTQLLFLPNLVIWSMAWLGGAGVSIGTGSLATPLGALVAPMPAMPALGAVPSGGGWQTLLLVVPVLAGAAGAWYGLRPLVRQVVGGWRGWAAITLAGLAQGLITAIVLLLLGVIASGAIGPGRMQEVGVPGWRMLIPAALIALGAVALGSTLVARRSLMPSEAANR